MSQAQAQAQAQVIQLINIVAPDVRCISGSVSKDGNDDQAYTAGAVRYIDPKALRPFATARAAANRLCRSNGTRFLSGFAVADDRMDKVLAGLEVIAAEVAAAKVDLESRYPVLRDEWEAANPSISAWKPKFPDVGYISRATGMSVAVYKINPQALPAGAMADGVEQAIQGMPWQLLQEIAQDVSESWLTGATRATQRIKGLLKRVRDKLRSLEFLGGHLRSIAQAVEDVMQRLPHTGPIEGSDYVLLTGLLHSLSDPNRIVNELGTMSSGMTVEDLWGLKEEPAPVAPVVPEAAIQASMDLGGVATEAAPESAAAMATVAVVYEEAVSTEPKIEVSNEATALPASAWAW